jgi:hypothetical protein
MEKIISPAVVFSESDLSLTREAPLNTDVVIVGPTAMGNYFIPQRFSSYDAFVDVCEGANKYSYTAIAVKNLLTEADAVTVLPVAKTEDYEVPFLLTLYIASGSQERTVAQLFLSKEGVSQGVTSASVSGQLNNFNIAFFSGSTHLSTFDMSGSSMYASDKANFIGNVVNPLSETYLFYSKYVSDVTKLSNSTAGFGTGFAVTTSSAILGGVEDTGLEFNGYKNGSTPWVVSQTIGASTNLRLFRFHTRMQGDKANRKVKISVVNQSLPSEISPLETYASFDIFVRSYTDTDAEPEILEAFTDVNLDPSSTRYIGRVIGDINVYFNSTNDQIEDEGTYRNNSNYIRVEMGAVDDFPTEAIPFGFERYNHAGAFFSPTVVPPYVTTVATGSSAYSGVNFDGYATNRVFIDSLHRELPKTAPAGFNTGSVSEVYVLAPTVASRPVVDRKFTIGFFGATDGFDPASTRNIGTAITATNCMGFDFSTATSEGTLAYRKAFDILKDDEFIDFKMLVVAGPNLEEHGAMLNFALDMCKSRGDVFAPLDAGSADATVTDLESVTSAYDSSFGAGYAPWYWINDSELGYILAPQSVLVPTTFAYNDKVARPWYANFGFNRGRIERGLKPYRKFNRPLRDRLEKARVNTVASVVNESAAVLLGQRTLQLRDTALSNANVRRLLIEMKKYIKGVAKYWIAEPNDQRQRSTIEEVIKNYCATVQRERGLEAFLVDFGPRLNTPDSIDRGLVKGIIYLTPTKAIKGIYINFVITNTGVDFNELL